MNRDRKGAALSAAMLFVAAIGVAAQTPNVSNGRVETRPFAGDLAAAIHSPSPAWFGYAARTTPGDHNSCCWEDGNRGCRLEKGSSTTINGSNGAQTPVPLEGDQYVAVLFRVENNDVEKVRVFSMSCPLDAGGLPFVWLTGVPPAASVAYLERLATTHTADKVADGAIMAVAEHQDAQADAALDRMVSTSSPERIREKAIFWLGAARGAAGLPVLKRVLASDQSDRIREKAVFALSISKAPDALPTLISTAKSDSSSKVRSQALFWLGQKAGKQAVAALTDAIENDPDTAVKEKAVFALSQLPKDEGVPRLIDVAKSNKNPRVRKQAFFWLGQSGDPRALAYIEQVLTK